MGGTRTILCVDDDGAHRQFIAAGMKQWAPGEFDVVLAAGGDEALSILAQRPVDLVLSDLSMPGMDGLELLRRIRERWHRRPALAMVSGESYTLTTARAQGIGAAALYDKPFPLRDVLPEIRALAEDRLYEVRDAITQSGRAVSVKMDGPEVQIGHAGISAAAPLRAFEELTVEMVWSDGTPTMGRGMCTWVRPGPRAAIRLLAADKESDRRLRAAVEKRRATSFVPGY